MFDKKKIADPTVFRENRLDAHSDHICYASREEEKQGKSSYRYSLDGVWMCSIHGTAGRKFRQGRFRSALIRLPAMSNIFGCQRE